MLAIWVCQRELSSILSKKLKSLNLIRKDKLCPKAAETAIRTNVLAVKLWRRKKKYMLILLMHLLNCFKTE